MGVERTREREAWRVQRWSREEHVFVCVRGNSSSVFGYKTDLILSGKEGLLWVYFWE